MVAVELVKAHQAEGGEQGLQGGAGRVGGAEVFVVAVAGPVLREHAHQGSGAILLRGRVGFW